MSPRLEEIGIKEFDLSLSSMRLMNLDRVAGLERSMKIHGQLQPVIARLHEGGIQMIDGFKRLYAAETLLMDSLECRLFEVSEAQAKVMLMSYNRTNQSMEVWEEAMILKDLSEGHAMDQRQLAKVTGHSPSWVSRWLSMISKLDEEVACEIRMGSITSSHARALMRLPRGNQLSVARVISNYRLSSRLSERLVDAYLLAEDADGRQAVLAHPEYIIWDYVCPCEDAYDSRLSSYGNEVMRSVADLYQPLELALTRLRDSCMDELEESEKGIIISFLPKVAYNAEKLSDTCKTY